MSTAPFSNRAITGAALVGRKRIAFWIECQRGVARVDRWAPGFEGDGLSRSAIVLEAVRVEAYIGDAREVMRAGESSGRSGLEQAVLGIHRSGEVFGAVLGEDRVIGNDGRRAALIDAAADIAARGIQGDGVVCEGDRTRCRDTRRHRRRQWRPAWQPCAYRQCPRGPWNRERRVNPWPPVLPTSWCRLGRRFHPGRPIPAVRPAPTARRLRRPHRLKRDWTRRSS